MPQYHPDFTRVSLNCHARFWLLPHQARCHNARYEPAAVPACSLAQACGAVQVCGGYVDTMTRCAKLLADQAEVDFVDINCGCPIDLICNKCALQPALSSALGVS